MMITARKRDALLVMLGTLAGFWLFERCVPEIGHDEKPLSIEPKECVELCIKKIQDNQVFPDFPSIVRECDWRFGNGCSIEGTGRPPEAARGK